MTTSPAPGRKPYRTFNAAAAIVLMGLLPLLVYYLWICVDFHQGALVVPTWQELARIPGPTLAAVGIYGAWWLLQVVLQLFAPGRTVLGTPLADGTRLPYRMNGWFSFWFTMGLLVVLWAVGWLPGDIVHRHFGPLLTTVNILAYGLSAYLYAYGKMYPQGEQVTGNVLYDYWLGTALNPRIGAFDLKFFCESRPGLIGWVVVDMSLMAEQYQRHGFVSVPMMLVVAFQFVYVADYFWHEEAILTTWDIKHENFGWMLCWGDLVWVPFTYTLQAFYLVSHPHPLPWWGTAGIVGLNLIGYGIFRASNLQKHRFRSNPDRPIWGRPAEYIQTQRGTLLLTSGWWGLSRHMNYLGDWLMALAWSLPCLFAHALPYFYPTYFAILLLHRERRDHAQCQARYGKDWDTYCQKVRWRIVPGIY